jgi:hypothetical protein
MSAAFTLDFSGPETPCDFPGCLLGSFHEGEHEFLSQQELNERAAAAVTSYGVDTRSYNRSAEKREMERQREIATARYQMMPRREILQPVTCPCAQRPYPHELFVHTKIGIERPGAYVGFGDELIRFASKEMRWPWSLKYAPSMER